MAGQQAVICVLGSRTLIRRDLAIVVGVHNIVTVMELSGIPPACLPFARFRSRQSRTLKPRPKTPSLADIAQPHCRP
jgi:hypothetical protein